MKTVFLVQHLHVLPSGEEEVKTIGIYASRPEAESAAERMRLQPGFIDLPKLINPTDDDAKDGFYIDEYPLNKDHWAKGYVIT